MPTAQSTHCRTGYRFAAIVAVALFAIGAIVFGAAVATADGPDELGNETVNVSADTDPLEVTVDFADEFNETDTETVTATFYNETEYADDPATATELHNVTVTGDPGETITEEVNVSETDALNLSTEYRLILTSTEENVDSVEIGGLIGGPVVVDGDGMPGFTLGAAVAALALATAFVAARRRGGGE
ncbi:hypothetical protein Halru_2041 [Halovivax ruber XH-70]|uniref:Uncharacterized protein n=1 Tax=Halovivax ruber (strain DSM 18193 / JCM 13892 / XH-70) TaxID=797302 RepID=L0IAL1_HALRX|nr:hypothetical protein [Halovivax ruber]AGB16635.1 hypothetical protein Halru_2041 [Halovivax ruber XH-70]